MEEAEVEDLLEEVEDFLGELRLPLPDRGEVLNDELLDLGFPFLVDLDVVPLLLGLLPDADAVGQQDGVVLRVDLE